MNPYCVGLDSKAITEQHQKQNNKDHPGSPTDPTLTTTLALSLGPWAVLINPHSQNYAEMSEFQLHVFLFMTSPCFTGVDDCTDRPRPQTACAPRAAAGARGRRVRGSGRRREGLSARVPRSGGAPRGKMVKGWF